MEGKINIEVRGKRAECVGLLIYFNRVGLHQRSKLARIHPDGSYDKSFDPGILGEGPQETIHCLAVRENGQILVGGSFRTFNGLDRAGLVALLPDGKLDPNANQGPGLWLEKWAAVNSIRCWRTGRF